MANIAYIVGNGTFKDGLPEPPLPEDTPFFLGNASILVGGWVPAPPLPTGKPMGSASIIIGGASRFIDSIFLAPAKIDVGTTAAESNHAVEVWHTYSQPLQITEIEELATQGIHLTRTDDEPDNEAPIPAAGLATYNIEVTNQTETVIDAWFRWNFDTAEQRTVNITGLRAVIFPFMPQSDFTESLEWQTAVLQAKRSEERHSVRAYPREELLFNFQLTPNEYSSMKNLMRGWNLNPFAIPLWMEVSQIGAVTEGTAEIEFDTTTGRYELGGMVALWDTNAFTQVGIITDLQPDSITFDPPLTEDRLNLYVAPVKLARVFEGAQINRTSLGAETIAIQFSLGATTFPDTNPFPLWRGHPVLDVQPVNQGSASETLFQPYNVLDFGTGIEVGLPSLDYMGFDRSLTYPLETRTELDRFRNFFGWARGQYEGFWSPSWNMDFELVEPAVSGSNELVIKPAMLSRYQEIDDFMIRLNNGTTRYHRISNVYVDVNGNEVLVISPNLDISFNPSDVHITCKLEYCRMNTDRIEISYARRNQSQVSFPIVKLPEEDI